MADQNIVGGRALNEMLKTLAPKLEKNILRSALRAGALVIRAEARAQVPVLDGALRKSVRVSTGSKKGGVLASVKAGGKAAPHGMLVEFGTKAHKIEPKDAAALSLAGTAFRSVNHPGAEPHPFLRPAFDSKTQEAIAEVAEKIRSRLTAEGLNVPAPE